MCLLNVQEVVSIAQSSVIQEVYRSELPRTKSFNIVSLSFSYLHHRHGFEPDQHRQRDALFESLEDRRGTSWVWVSLCAEVYSLGKLGYSPAGGLMEAIGDYVGHPESTLRIKWMVQQSRADDGSLVCQAVFDFFSISALNVLWKLQMQMRSLNE